MAERVPKLTPETIRAALTHARERLGEQRKDEEDRRCLRGKHAPPTGTCRVCGGEVQAVVRFASTDRLGGPKPNAHVERWECADCGLLYGRRPGKE